MRYFLVGAFSSGVFLLASTVGAAPAPEIPGKTEVRAAVILLDDGVKKVLPFKASYGRFDMINRTRKSRALSGACEGVYATADALLLDKKLPSGTPDIDQNLLAMLKTFKEASEACLADDLKKFNAGYQLGEQQLNNLAQVFSRYKLPL